MVIDFVNQEVWADWLSAMELLHEKLQSVLKDCASEGMTHKNRIVLNKWLKSFEKAEEKWNVIAPSLLSEKATLVRFLESGGVSDYCAKNPPMANYWATNPPK